MKVPDHPDGSEPYRADHLLLIVGGNPLPNAVAARTLVQPGGRISLICTDGTQRVMQRFEQWLLKGGWSQENVKRVRVDDSEAHSIYRSVSEALQDTRPGERVGLNYTGGTKAMAVHTYRAVQAWAERSGALPICTYLDARSLLMRVDPEDFTHAGGARSFYTGLLPRLKLEDLLALHGWRFRKAQGKQHRPSSQPKLMALAIAIGQALQHEDGLNAWNGWKHSWREEWQRAKQRNARGAKLLEQKQIDLPGDWRFADARAEMKKLFGSAVGARNGQHHLHLGDAAREAGLADAVEVCSWFDGLWLESLVLEALYDNQSRFDLHDLGMNLQIEATGRDEARFEFDVAAMRGSQLFAFSCSTAHRHSDLKHKLFEMYVRARQFGGDQACMALVCASGEPDLVQEEARQGLDTNRILVIGREDLDVKRLGERIGAWIASQLGAQVI